MHDLAIDSDTEQARFLRPAGIPGIEALHATFVRHQFPLHTHPTFTIALVERGAASFQLDGRHCLAPAGSVFVIPPRAPHTGESATPGGYTYKVLYVDPECAAGQLGGRIGRPPWGHGAVLARSSVANTLARLHRLLLLSPAGLEWEEALGTSLAGLEEVLTSRGAAEPPRCAHRAVRRARAYLEDHFTERVTLRELAEHAGVSQYHLSRIFHAHLGMPPSAYQRQLRIELAKQELRKGLSAARVAVDCGFSDQAHLSREFKRMVGVGPGAFSAAQ